MKKRFFIPIMLFVALFMMSACGDNEATGPDGQTLITLWTHTTGPDGDLIRQNIDRFNQTNGEFYVEVVMLEAGTMFNRLATSALVGEDVPDIAMIASEQVYNFFNQGLLTPWDEHIAGTTLTAANYIDTAWNLGTFEGRQYGIPMSMTSWIMYYNRELVERYIPGALDDGIVTYAEIFQAGENIRAAGSDTLAMGFTWPMQNVTNLYMQKGGQFVRDGHPYFENDIAAATFQVFKDMHDQGFMNTVGEDSIALFNSGQVIFLPEGTWMISDMLRITDFEWGMTLTPQWDANNLVQGSGIPHFTLFNSDDRTERRMEGIVTFVEWLQTNQVEWLLSGANPTALGMLTNEEFLAMPQSFVVTEPRFRDSVRVIVGPGVGGIMGNIDGRFWDITTGIADIRQSLREIQQYLDDIMAHN